MFSSTILEKNIDILRDDSVVKMYLVNAHPPNIIDVYVWNIEDSSFCWSYGEDMLQWKSYSRISEEYSLFSSKKAAACQLIEILRNENRKLNLKIEKNNNEIKKLSLYM